VVLQYKLGAKNAGTFDVDCACAAFPALVAIGAGLIATNAAMKTVLLVGVDMIHRLTDPNDPGCFLWSDGAGAAVLEGGNEAGFIGAAFQADGAYAAGWGILASGTFEPANVDAVKDRRTMMRREAGNYPASVNEDNWPRLFRRLSDQCGFSAHQVDQLLFTQISKSSIKVAAERCNVPHAKIWLHRLCVYSDGIRRCHRTRQDQTRSPCCHDSIRTWMEPSCSGDSHDRMTAFVLPGSPDHVGVAPKVGKPVWG
jgi:3-oxoacyl-[acyl-carrier-protein] synthase III